ncbi:hypothetical protein OXT66_06670 [Lentilactobacillus senioris]|uniref:hypothetical protein n=1 Tax=Lentilactobacillus senioris TaxID=931534 RepID=UPI002282CD28|nr:hypothetical protein [Lentilactobacillus senioris]MCY9807217.1 hypothetical protein [Lentilactobacillus senioris]
MKMCLYFNQTELDHSQVTKVVDEHHHTRFLIMGTWGIAGDSFTIYSPQGIEILEIKQLTAGKNAAFTILANKTPVMKSNWHRSFLATEMVLLSSSWQAIGNRRTQKYQIRQYTKLIAKAEPFGRNGQWRQVCLMDNESTPIVLALIAALGHPQMMPLFGRHKKVTQQPDTFGV